MTNPQGIAVDTLWHNLVAEMKVIKKESDLLAGSCDLILAHDNFTDAMIAVLSNKLATEQISAKAWTKKFHKICKERSDIPEMWMEDMVTALDRDPVISTGSISQVLGFKGFLAIATHRLGNHVWTMTSDTYVIYDSSDASRSLTVGQAEALKLQELISEKFQIDIHPQVPVGRRVFFDHGTGIVIGQTAVIEDDVSILQNVTLGGTGKESGDRHPKIRKGVLIGAGAKVLGNIEIGEGAAIGAGSVVMNPVMPHQRVVGVPAKPTGQVKSKAPGVDMTFNCVAR